MAELRGSRIERIGGMDGCLAVSRAFFLRVEHIPELRALYPEHLKCAVEHISQYLYQLLGGHPSYFSLMRFHCLRNFHAKLPIEPTHVVDWWTCMRATLQEIPDAPLREELLSYFEATLAYLQGGEAPAGDDELAHGLCVSQRFERLASKITLEQDLEAPIELPKPELDSLLQHAAKCGNGGAARTLLANGADCSAVTIDADMLLRQAPLCALLLSRGATLEGPPGRNSPLIQACRGDKGGRVERVRILLKRGANPNRCNTAGMTPLHYAARAGFTDIVLELLQAGAKSDTLDQKGRTPRDYAEIRGKWETVRALDGFIP